MRFIFGLGNPGAEYQQSRHNVGWLMVEALASELAREAGTQPYFQAAPKVFAEWLKLGSTVLAKPQTFMNESGKAVRAVLDYYKQPLSDLSQVYVIHDDLDLALGTYKVQLGTGPKIHNGLLSIYQHLGTQEFWHVRLGVDNRDGDRTMPGKNYVLQAFSAAEQPLLNQVITQVITRLETPSYDQKKE